MIDPSVIRVVWVDLDDTLIDFKANSRSALSKLYESTPPLKQYFATPKEWTERYQHHNHLLWAALSAKQITRDFLITERFLRPLTEAGMTETEARTLASELHPRYLDLLAQEKNLVAGAIPLLERLRNAGLKIGVLSNGFKEVQHRKITTAGLSPYIDLVVLSDDIGVQKPDPRLFAHAMSLTGEPSPKAHAMIGDNPDTDISGALNSGWQAIFFDPSVEAPTPPGAVKVGSLDDITIG